MKTKIFLLLTFLILAVSCSKNSTLDPSGITIANYEGTYTGKGKLKSASSTEEKDITVIVNKDATVVFKADANHFTFNNITKIDDKNYSSMKMESGSLLIFSLIFDGNGNLNISLLMQSTSEEYTADKLTKTAS
ncbi:hypothetical protein [Brachyspira alvinipulli]|uniref:hypothetical protein n=1 Tax=Brachyspira alvinipulli TaxID=84379 RepID=UPI000489E9CC|nr:hypothetical protein [Brachyspira alvinipulli]